MKNLIKIWIIWSSWWKELWWGKVLEILFNSNVRFFDFELFCCRVWGNFVFIVLWFGIRGCKKELEITIRDLELLRCVVWGNLVSAVSWFILWDLWCLSFLVWSLSLSFNKCLVYFDCLLATDEFPADASICSTRNANTPNTSKYNVER